MTKQVPENQAPQQHTLDQKQYGMPAPPIVDIKQDGESKRADKVDPNRLLQNEMVEPVIISAQNFDAVLFDMDGIITKTAGIHAQAWKTAFDAFLEKTQGGKSAPFDIKKDYAEYVDGKPRNDGVRSFLESRKINLPEGTENDSPGFDSINALGSIKNQEFHILIETNGVEVYESTIELIQGLKQVGLKVAVITASKNGAAILQAANVHDVFDAKVDGLDIEKLNLKGKPAPDSFLLAAKELGVAPQRAVVIEDAEAGVEAGHKGGFGLVIGVDRDDHAAALKKHGADVVVGDLAEVGVPGRPRDISGTAMADLGISDAQWVLSFDSYDPKTEGRREALCAMGNGFIVCRASAAESSHDEIHAPGTYMAGLYNRLVFEHANLALEHEDLVNLPNWLSLTFRIEDGEWFSLDQVEILAYSQKLNLREGILRRKVRFRDKDQHVTTLTERRFVHMRQSHLACLETIITPENWSGTITLRTALDGNTQNIGTKLYGRFDRHHLEPMEAYIDGEMMYVKVKTKQSGVQIAEAVRTDFFLNDSVIKPERYDSAESGCLAQEVKLNIEQGERVKAQKIAAIYSSRDYGISEAGLSARKIIRQNPDFESLANEQIKTWMLIWRRFDLALETEDVSFKTQTCLLLHLHSFQTLQTISHNSIDLDVGIPARGWSEGYQGHVFWDDLFVQPFLNLRLPELSQSVLKYRYRRLDEARQLARQMGLPGARFPWQSGSSGREETPASIWYPQVREWVPDYSHLQMHVNAAVAYNVWQYYQTTGQIRFMYMYGACLLLEIARFFAHLAKKNESTGRYEICGVVGPDEFHVGYPDSRQPGINNNAYTNTMAAWTLCRALELLAILPQDHSQEVCERLNISAEELQLWEDVSKKMYIPIEENGIIWQFSGYENLEEFPGYTDGRLDMEKVNEALREFGGVLNKYKVSKQADVLMLFYVFSADELSELYDRLGYKFDTKGILRNIEYYSKRTANTSTLSRVALTWVLSRMDRTNAWSLLSTFSNPEAPAAVQIPKKEGEVVSGASAKSPDNLSRPDSWSIFREALGSDFWDIQGGTTPEGIHIGAMAGTVDIVQRCYTGIVTRDDVLWLNPRLPKEMVRLAFHFQYRNQVIRLEITRKTATVCVGYSSAKPIKLGFGKEIYELHAGDKKIFKLEVTEDA